VACYGRAPRPQVLVDDLPTQDEAGSMRRFAPESGADSGEASHTHSRHVGQLKAWPLYARNGQHRRVHRPRADRIHPDAGSR